MHDSDSADISGGFMGAGLSIAIIFKLWMLLDAVRRGGVGCGNYWPMVVLFPFGDVAYFFMVKARDPEFQRFFGRWFGKIRGYSGADLRRLAFEVEHCPSEQNRINLFRALVGHQKYAEALSAFGKLVGPSEELQVFAAEAMLGTGLIDDALRIVRPIVTRNVAFAEYEAARIYESCLWQQGKRSEALQFLESLGRQSGRLGVAIHLAERLIEESRTGDATQVLEKALYGYRCSPKFIKKAEFWDSLRAWKLKRQIARGAAR